MFQRFHRLWLYRVSVGRMVLILFAGIALIAVTISGFGWFTAKSSAATTGATPTQPENLPTTLVLSDSQVASTVVGGIARVYLKGTSAN